MLQSAMTGNLSPEIAQAGLDVFLPAIRRAVQAEGLRDDWYNTTSADPQSPVAMGGVQPDTWRNIGGLRNAVSILHETRGIGLGKAHLARRVQSHVVAAQALIEQMAAQGPALVALGRRVDRDVAAQACKGQITVAAGQTPEKRTLTFYDAKTGAELKPTVDWGSALTLRVQRERARPCGYWLAPSEKAAVEALRALGVQVKSMPGARQVSAPRYVFKSAEQGQRAGRHSGCRRHRQDRSCAGPGACAVARWRLDGKPGAAAGRAGDRCAGARFAKQLRRRAHDRRAERG